MKMKLKTISEIKSAGLDVKKIIINHNLSEAEATIVEHAMKGVDILKCAKLARQLLDRQIRDVEKRK